MNAKSYLNLLVIFSAFVCFTCTKSSGQVSGKQSLTPSAVQGKHLFVDYWSTVLDVSMDENSALIFDGKENVVRVGIKSGLVERRIPVRRGNLGASVQPTAQFSSDANVAWTLFPDYMPAVSPEEKARLENEVDSMTVPAGQVFLLDSVKENTAAIINNTHGSFLVKWDLRSGEAVGELKAKGRSIQAFDQKGYQSKYIATLESAKGISAFQYWLCIYNCSNLKKIAEVALPDGEENLGDLFRNQVTLDEKNALVSVVYGKRLSQFKFGQNLPLIASKQYPRDYHEPMITSHFDGTDLLLARSVSSYTDQGLRFNDEVNHFDFARKTLSATEATVVTTFTMNELPDYDRSKLFGFNKGQIILSCRNEALRGTAIVFDKATRSTTKILSQYQLEERLLNGEFLSTVGVHDSRGTLIRIFSESTSSGAHDLSAQNGRVVASNRRLLANSQDSALEVTDSHIAINKLNSATSHSSFPLQEFVPKEENATASVQLDLIQAAFSLRQQAFIIAIPLRTGLTPQDRQELQRMIVSSGDPNRRLEEDQLQLVGEALFGYKWKVFKVDIDGGKPIQLHQIDRSPSIKLAESGGSVAMLTLERLHSAINLTIDLGNKNERKLTLESKQAAKNRLAASLGIICDMRVGIEESDDQSGVPSFYSGMIQLSLEMLSPNRNLCFHGTKNGFVYGNALPTHNGPAALTVALVNNDGQVTIRKEITLLPRQLQVFMQMTEASAAQGGYGEGSSLTGMASLLAPFAIGYCRSENTIYVLGQSFEGMDIGLSAFSSSASAQPIAKSESRLAMTAIRIDDGKVIRTFTADWLLDELNPQSRAFEIPDALTFDTSSEFCSVTFNHVAPRTVLSHVPTQSRLLTVTGKGSIAFVGTQVAVNGRVAKLSEVQKQGYLAFHSDIGPAVVTSDGNSKTSNASNCYFLGIAGKTFVDSTFPALRYAEEDISALSALIQNECTKKGIRYVPTLLTGNSRTAAHVGTAIFDIEKTVEPEDTVVIAVSSHGIRLNRGLYVVLPTSDSMSLQATAIGWPEFVHSISKLHAKNIYVYLDVCHAGSFSEASIAVLDETKKRLQAIPGLIVFASSKANEFSLELDDVKHGAFTQSLLEVLSAKGALGFDPIVIAKDVSVRVKELTNGSQTPQLIISNPANEISLSSKDVKNLDPRVVKPNQEQKATSAKEPDGLQSPHGTGGVYGTIRRETRVMNGKSVLGSVAVGTVFLVRRSETSWLLGDFDLDGGRCSGWVNAKDVVLPDQQDNLELSISPDDR